MRQFIFLIISLILFSPLSLLADDVSINLSNEERKWLKNHLQVRVGGQMDWAPFDFVEDGNWKGISKEIIDLIAVKTGLKLEYVTGLTWKTLLDDFKKGKLDILPAIYYTKEREDFTRFTKSYFKIRDYAFVRSNESNLQSIEDLRDKKVAVIDGYAIIQNLRNKWPDIGLVTVDSMTEGIDAVLLKRADVYIDAYPTVMHNLTSTMQSGLKPTLPIDFYSNDLHIGINKSKPLLASIFIKGMESISQKEKNVILQKWMAMPAKEGSSATEKLIQLTESEKSWVASHPVVKVANDNEWAPFDFFENGRAKGYSMDYLRILAKSIGIQLEFVQGDSWDKLINQFESKKIDVITAYEDNSEHRKSALFTEPFLKTFESIIIRKETQFLRDYKDLYGKKVAVIRGYDFEEVIKKNHTDIKMILVDSPLEGLRKVSYGEADALLENTAVAEYLILHHGFTNLMLAGNPSFPGLEVGDKISIAVRKDWPELHSLFTKAMRNIPEDKLVELNRRWLGSNKPEKPSKIQLNQDETSFLKKNPVIKVSNETNWPPFDFAVDGRPQGYMIDLMNLLAQRIGIKLEYITSDSWSGLQDQFRQKKLDVLHSINKTPEREKQGLFSLPLYHYKNYFIIKRGTSDIQSINNLKGKTIAVPKGWAYEEFLSTHHSEVKLLTTKDSLSAFQAVLDGKAVATIESLPVANYIFTKHYISELKISSWFKSFDSNTSRKLHIMAHFDQPELISMFNKAMASMTPGELSSLEKKWIGEISSPESQDQMKLSEKELLFTQNHPQFFFSEVDRAPLSVISPSGDFDGLIADYLKSISGKAGIQFKYMSSENWAGVLKKYENQEISMIPNISRDDSINRKILYSKPYITFPLVIVTREDVSFIKNMSSLYGKKVAVGKGYTSAQFLTKVHPEIELIETKDVPEGLLMTSNKEVFAFVGHLAVAVNYLQKMGLKDLKVAGDGGYTYEHRIGIDPAYPELLSLINKSLDTMSASEKRIVYDKWLPVEFETTVDYSQIWKYAFIILIVASSIFLIILVWNRRLASEIVRRQKVEIELQGARDIAEEATKAKSDFLANMSHEIRTPMNAIIGMSYLALQTELNKKQRNYIDKVNRSAESLLGIINDILDFSKIEAGKMDMESLDFRLENVMDNLANLVGFKAEEKGVELLFDLAADVPMDLVGDPLRLGQILVNLGNNAVKFTENGEIVVLVKVKEITEDSVTLHFAVRDSGIGMTPEQQNKLFQSFSQADSSTSRKYGGTGLGLTISKRLSEMMNGEIWVETEAGKGSTFQFTAKFGRQSKAFEQKEKAKLSELQGLFVLVVDDNASAREISVNILESLGFKVESAASGQAALDRIGQKEKPFDLILMDWQMPGLDGMDTTLQIQQKNSAPPIILVTAFGREEALEEQKEARFSCVLTKPFTPSDLLTAIMEALGYEAEGYGRGSNLGTDLKSILKKLRGAKILLVEDNEINQELAMELLSNNGLISKLAENGQVALDILEQETFDGVLMDCQMPIMDGYTASRKIREQEKFKNLPVIAMTANVMAGDREKVIDAGMNDHIGKPINVDEMFSVMAKWIVPSKLMDETIETKTEVEKTNSEDTKAEEGFPPLAGIDIKKGFATTQNNHKLYRKLLIKFRDNQRDFQSNFHKAQQDSDPQAATRCAHTLKGVAGSIGAIGVYDSAQELESALNAGETDEKIEGLLTKVVLALEPVIMGLEALDHPVVEGDKRNEGVLKKIDATIVKPLIDELTNLLEEDDTDAAKVLEKLKELLKGPDTVEALTKVEQCISEYDFEEALEHMKIVAHQFL
ncbi:MAG: transporter substrate-binding domain-containing protein [SAR324 cluster bacterium]|nr:transporter substrate-binding domain-containing protein [SAR324 cluster bacterium]